MKKKIYFLAPKNKWGTYFYYKEISEYLIRNNSDIYDIKFCNTFIDYIKLHFIKSDIIFSIIPFLFKPLFTKRFIFNLHWNYKIERKNKWLWVKLLYFTEVNFWFSDKIILTSYYLADKLNFREKYNKKIKILPNFIDNKNFDFWDKEYDELRYKILTITNFTFLNKWKWILNLWNVISKLWKNTNKKIIWTIIWNDDSINFLKIKKEFDKIIFWKNIKVIWKWWCKKDEIKWELKNNDYFLYWTFFDNFPWVILEAIASKMKVLVNNFESFKYFLDKEIICRNEDEMLKKILSNSISINTVEEFWLERIIKDIINIINKW